MKTTNNFIRTALMLFVTAFFISCGSDDNDKQPVSYPEENPLAKYIETAGFTKTVNYINGGDYEFGLVFSPKVNGKINAITAKLPDVNTNLRVTIWDFDSQTVLRTEHINVASADTEVVKTIDALDLQKDKKYVITMNSNDWYNRSKPNNSDATYPITAGNIVFHDYRFEDGTAQSFPTYITPGYYGGDVSFVFQQVD